MSVLLFSQEAFNADLIAEEAVCPYFITQTFTSEAEITAFITGAIKNATTVGYIAHRMFERKDLEIFFKDHVGGVLHKLDERDERIESGSFKTSKHDMLYLRLPFRQLMAYQRAVFPHDKINCSQLMLIDASVHEADVLYAAANSTTLPVMFNSWTLLSEIKGLKNKYCLANCRLAIVADNSCMPSKLFLQNENYFTSSDLQSNVEYSANMAFLYQEFKTVDFLACKTLLNPDWQTYYAVLKGQGVTVGASNDETGNLNYGGDWVMESTSEDIQGRYFSEGIQNYQSTLDIQILTLNAGPQDFDLSSLTTSIEFTYSGLTRAKVNLIGTWNGTGQILVNGNNITFDGPAATIRNTSLFKINGGTGIIIENITVRSTTNVIINGGKGGICDGNNTNYSVDFINCHIYTTQAITIHGAQGGEANATNANASANGGGGGIAGGDYSNVQTGTLNRTFTDCSVNAGTSITIHGAQGGVATAMGADAAAYAFGGGGGIAGGDYSNVQTGTLNRIFTGCSVNAGTSITIHGAQGGEATATGADADAYAFGGGGGIAGGDYSNVQTGTLNRTFTGCSVNAYSTITIHGAQGGEATATGVYAYVDASAFGGGGGIAGGDNSQVQVQTGTLNRTFTGICSLSATNATGPSLQSGLTPTEEYNNFKVSVEKPAYILSYSKKNGFLTVKFDKNVTHASTAATINGLTYNGGSGTKILKFNGTASRFTQEYGSCILCDTTSGPPPVPNAFLILTTTGAAVISFVQTVTALREATRAAAAIVRSKTATGKNRGKMTRQAATGNSYEANLSDFDRFNPGLTYIKVPNASSTNANLTSGLQLNDQWRVGTFVNIDDTSFKGGTLVWKSEDKMREIKFATAYENKPVDIDLETKTAMKTYNYMSQIKFHIPADSDLMYSPYLGLQYITSKTESFQVDFNKQVDERVTNETMLISGVKISKTLPNGLLVSGLLGLEQDLITNDSGLVVTSNVGPNDTKFTESRLSTRPNAGFQMRKTNGDNTCQVAYEFNSTKNSDKTVGYSAYVNFNYVI